MLNYYLFFVLLSYAFTLTYICMMDKRLSVYFTAIQILVPIINLSCYWTASSTTLEGGLMGQKLSYLGGVFLPPLIFFAMAGICNIRVRQWIISALYAVAFGLYIVILTCEKHTLFYKAVSFRMVNGTLVLEKEYGIFHTIVYVVIGMYAIGVIALLYVALKKRKNSTSLRTMYLLALSASIMIVVFFGRRWLMPNADPVLVYTVAQGLFLIVAARSYKYQVDDVIMDSMYQMGELGCIIINRYNELLGANETARQWFPEINDEVVDLPIRSKEGICFRLYGWIRNVEILKKGIETSYKPENSKDMYRVIVDRIDRKNGYKILIQKMEKGW